MNWSGVAAWVREHAPALHAAFLPPSGIEIGGVPPDLAAWWREFDGVDRAVLGDESPLLPLSWHPLDVVSALRRRTRADRLPIAADCFDDADLLFVDLHDGSVVTEETGREWDRVTAMLDHVLRMFERNDDPVYRLLRYEDGHINWDTRPTLTRGSHAVQ
ncbi:hypothetical protein G7043_38515 [Lentzea sp. NEAU-D13]|uniref:SMI1 / KNR4 family (SUKH-1) n=1 Tax=Lentzea alba TaxID=2714351 RepID=A0A7C9RWT1_9PSEU|nr:hypothetical protein [Lentzea alba]NGY64824.1 hypothetical protein [Lentzea alba]